MSATDSLTLLLNRYLDLRSRGESVAIEDLCRDNPELLADLRREIAAMELLASTAEFTRPIGQSTREYSEPTDHCGAEFTDLQDTEITDPQIAAVNRSAALAASPRPAVSGYELLEELGRGGMGVVFKARQVNLNRVVALKLIPAGGFQNQAGRERFLAEAAVVARMQHQNVVQIFEFCARDDQLYFSMELCEGGSLAQRLRSGPLLPREAAALMRSLAGGVQAAHDQGIIHRDLSPGNILLARRAPPEGEQPAGGPRPLAEFIPKISDFGLAKQIDVEVARTRSGVILGTPLYMAPEQAVDPRAIDHRADVYALGAILYECLTGRPPFLAETMLEVLDQVLHHEPVPIRQLRPDVPLDLETICLKCLSKEPHGRYATARELADDLGRFLQGEPIRARSDTLLERFARWCRRPERVTFAGKFAIILHGSLAVWKLTALVLVALGLGVSPRDVGQSVFQILAAIALLNVPQIAVGFATLARWPPAARIGAILALFHLALVSVCIPTSLVTFGGLLERSNIRWLVWSLLIIQGCVTFLAYLAAIIAQRAGRHDAR